MIETWEEPEWSNEPKTKRRGKIEEIEILGLGADFADRGRLRLFLSPM
jgi:hypothetical protein